MRRTFLIRSILKAKRVHDPPLNGYEVSELPNEKLFEEYMRRFGSKQLVIAVVHSGNVPVSINDNVLTFGSPSLRAADASKQVETSSVLHPSSQSSITPTAVFDPVARSLVSGFNLVNLGHPDDVKIVTVPGNAAPTLASAFHILTYPTSLIFFRNKYIDRVTGCRFQEVATKCLFTLRNNNCDIYSAFEYRPHAATDNRVSHAPQKK